MKKSIVLAVLSFLLLGCAPAVVIDEAIEKYEVVAGSINLGDSRDKVLSILLPTQKELKGSYKKSADKYLKEGVLVEIYYMRSGRQADGLTTDDEFTPYIFNDGKLVGIGWAMLGGAKTQGQASDTHTTTTNTTVIVR